MTAKATQGSVLAVRKRLGLSLSEMANELSCVRLKDLQGTLAGVRSLTRHDIWKYEHGRRNPDRLLQLALAVVERRAKKKKKGKKK